MLVPEPQDLSNPQKIMIDFQGRYSQLYDNFSPILPLHFDKSYLPKNICQREYIDLVQCTLFNYHDKQFSCSYNIALFEQCRKVRDLKILEGIKKWQVKHIKELDSKNKQLYLQGLTFKLDRLKQQYSKLPSTQAQQLKLHRMDSQIQQLKWRMKNIRNVMKQQEELKKENWKANNMGKK